MMADKGKENLNNVLDEFRYEHYEYRMGALGRK